MDKAFYNLTSLEDVKNIKDWIDKDPLKEERIKVYNIVHKYSDGKSGLKTAEYIYNLLQNS